MSLNHTDSRRKFLRAGSAMLTTSIAGCLGSNLRSPNTRSSNLQCTRSDTQFPSGWPMYGFDSQNTGRNPDANGPKDTVRERWTYQTAGSIRGGPVVTEDTVYLQESPTRLSAITRTDGTNRWSVKLAQPDSSRVVSNFGTSSTPAVVDEVVYIQGGYIEVEKDGPPRQLGDSHVYLYAIDRQSGDVNWKVNVDERIATAPIVVGDAILFVTLSGTVYAVDRKEKTTAWRLQIDEVEAPIATPAVDECRLYLNTVENGLHAIDIEDGELSWRLPTVTAGAPPVVGKNRVYVAGRDGTVYAIDPREESIRWTYSVGRAISTASPAIASGRVFVADVDGDAGKNRPRIHAIDASTGDELWSANTNQYVNSSPAIADGVLYVADTDRISAYDTASGEKLWNYDTSGGIRAPLTVAGETVYAGTWGGKLYALA